MYLVYFASYIEFENCYHGVNNSSIIFNQTKSKHDFFCRYFGENRFCREVKRIEKTSVDCF